jgi:dolichyl-phosphate-mannose--protein O-mannosyl transferase
VTQLQLKTQTKILWALAGITALAAFVRFWQITSLPPGYWYDEAHKSLVALEILRGIRYPIYVTDIDGLEAGYFWLLAAVFRVGGPSYFGTRGLAAFIGTATIPLTFWAARRLYHRHPYVNLIALTSAGVLGFIFWHVHFSRFGIETITVPFFSVAVCAVIAWAWQQQTTGAFVFAGVVLGLSQYTNPGARVLPLEAVLVFAIFGNWTQRKRLLGFGLK